MKIIRFKTTENKIRFGCDYDGVTASLADGDLFQGLTDTGKRVTVEEILPPLDPAAIFCIGLNYRAHAKEIGMDLPRYPVVFMKNPGAAAAHGDDIVLPASCLEKPEVDYEAELGVVMGTACKNVSPDSALDHVLGYTCANDISARRWQKHAGGGQWIKAKSFDTFCPFGPVLATPDEVPDPQALNLSSVLNGRTMQQSSTADMIFTVAQIISYLSQSATLLPGTLILTGTPEGVGFTRNPPVYLMPGDTLVTTVEGIGTLENSVVAEPK